jgi:hypothetical protein
MTTGNDPKELSDLEPLEDVPDFEEIPDLDDVPDLAPVEELSAPEPPEELPAEVEAPAPARPAKSGPRELEKAPLMLQKAALILTIAALLPWFVPGGWDVKRVIAKAVICLGGYVLYMGVCFTHDEKVPGVFASIGKLHKQALTILGAALMGLAVAPTIDSGPFAQTLIEKIAVAIGLVTWCQVATYAKGGKFNPMLGLIIPFFAFAGLGRLITVFGDFDLFALLGSAGVTGAGGFAGYTMYLAMKEAKEHGKKKKQVEMEKRKQARRAKNKQK